MTKAQELAILDTAITALGDNSYLGPWLASVRAEVVRDVTSDIIPAYTLASSEAQRRVIVEAAKVEAARIVENAEAGRARSVRVIDEQQAEAARQIAMVAENLKRLATGLSRY